MALLDFLTGGKKPVRRGPTGAETRLISATDQLNSERGGLGNAVTQHAELLASGRRGERSDYLGEGAADVQQNIRGATTSAGALDNALRRGKGLSRVYAARNGQFDNQLLRERLSFTKAMAARRGRGLGALATAAGLSENLAGANQAKQISNQRVRAGTAGTLAGIGAGFAQNAFMHRNDNRTPGDLSGSGVVFDTPVRQPQNTGIGLA